MRLHIEAEGDGPTVLLGSLIGIILGGAIASFVHHRYQEIAAADFAERIAFEAAYAGEDDEDDDE